MQPQPQLMCNLCNQQPWSTHNQLKFGLVASLLPVWQPDFKTLIGWYAPLIFLPSSYSSLTASLIVNLGQRTLRYSSNLFCCGSSEVWLGHWTTYWLLVTHCLREGYHSYKRSWCVDHTTSCCKSPHPSLSPWHWYKATIVGNSGIAQAYLYCSLRWLLLEARVVSSLVVEL